MIIVGIDPGPNESGVARVDTVRREITGANVPNDCVHEWFDQLTVIEKAQSFGKGFILSEPLIEAIEWSGALAYLASATNVGNVSVDELIRYTRPTVKTHLLGRAAGDDAQVRAALIVRFGGDPQSRKKEAMPEPLRGIASHMWPALALAVVAAEKRGLVAWPEWRSGWRRA